jgi:quercetin dioxygenase-like cupin family protein
MRNAHRIALAGASAIGLSLFPSAPGAVFGQSATPGSGVTAKTVTRTTVAGTDYILREITIAPGGSTGWHYHDGTLYALVKRGTLSHADDDCETSETHRTGSTFVEPSGPEHVHIGRNLGAAPVVLEVIYVDPAGSPLSRDAADPGCGFR